jgi:hypothetical protein
MSARQPAFSKALPDCFVRRNGKRQFCRKLEATGKPIPPQTVTI